MLCFFIERYEYFFELPKKNATYVRVFFKRIQGESSGSTQKF
jgi:hypothetical protein